MRIHRIRLVDFKGVRDCEVSFAERGVTIIEGDNEVGKTSLVQALDLLLSARDDSRHRSVRDAKPVDRDAGVEVEAEISTGPYRFVYRKRWHKSPRLTELRVLEPSPEQLTGREAHDRVEELLAETLDPQLWNALRVEQGTELSQGRLEDCDSLSRSLDAAAGGDTSGEADDTLWERIVAESEQYVTPTGRTRSERTDRAARVDGLVARVAELEEQLAGLDRDTEQVARLTVELGELADRLDRARGTESELAERARRVDGLRAKVAELSARVDAARAEHAGHRSTWDTRKGLVEQLDRRCDGLATLDGALERARPAGAAARRRRDEIAERLTAARAAVDDDDAAHRAAVADVDQLRQLIEVDQLTERRDRVVAAQSALDAAEAALESATVDDELLERIEAAHLDVEKARARLEAGAARLEATALAPVELTFGDDTVHLDGGGSHGVTVSDTLDVTVPGLVELRVRAGGEARGLSDDLARVEGELSRSLSAAGVHDVTAARRAVAARADAARAAVDARGTIDRDLRDLTVDSLHSKVDRLRERIDTFASTRPADPPLPPDLDAAQELAAGRAGALDASRRAIADIEDEQQEAARTDERTNTELVDLEARRSVESDGVAELTRSLEQARAEAPDAALEAEVTAAAGRLGAVEADHTEAERALAAADPDSVDELLDNARASLRRVDEDHAGCEQRRRELLARLEVHGEQGLAEQLDTARTDLEHERVEHERIEARAAAALLLHDTFRAHRDEARSRYLAPFRDRIERLGRLVYGPSFSVELGDDLCIESRTLEGTTVGFDQLSVGAREQLGILSRLACASIVSADGGAPVVVDDALGWSDPGRIERMGAALAVAGRDCQVIVLTCTPGRYSAVGDATVVRLPAP